MPFTFERIRYSQMEIKLKRVDLHFRNAEKFYTKEYKEKQKKKKTNTMRKPFRCADKTTSNLGRDKTLRYIV